MRGPYLIILTLSASCRLGFDARSDATTHVDANLASARLRKPIVIPASFASEQLTDFPILVAATDPELAHARADGRDLLFADAASVILPHELLEWDGQGALRAWVRVPVVATSETTFFVYYGGDPQPALDPTAVWSSYAGVWHFDGGSPIDSSPRASPTTILGAPAASPGVTGGSLTFNGQNDSLTIANPIGLGDFRFTLSAWVNGASAASGNDYVIDFANLTAADPSKVSLKLTDNVATVTLRDDGGVLVEMSGGPNLATAWHHVAAVGDGATASVLVDGTVVATVGLPPGSATTVDASIGRHARLDVCCFFEGAIDEPRITNSARPPAWLAAEFANQRSPMTTAVLGPEQQVR